MVLILLNNCRHLEYSYIIILHITGRSRIFERGVADLTEQYQNNPRQNRLCDSFVPFLNFKLKQPQRGGWLATQSTPPGTAPTYHE